MNALDRYQAARDRGDARVASALELRPFTCILGFAFLMSFVTGAVYVVVFADSPDERLLHFWRAFATTAMLGIVSAYFFIREKREPLPLSIRRFVLRSIVYTYAVIVIVFVALSLSPLARGTGVFVTLLRLGAVAPVPAMAWHILMRMKEANKPPQTTTGSSAPDRV
jgi:hypothetical protein